MSARLQRKSATTALVVTAVLLITDLFFIFYDHPLDGVGILSTFILPPAGILFGLSAYKMTRSRKDIILILLNAAAFVSYFAYMFFGTLILGP
ncbi:hypothetical protein R70723_04200 [Paenibacillus sp. FSL R7-0273]|uniref:hypothetical protein n=1 Tax=Paenibacillus sp. FSL R7-0273 TaxID=1536772 RepID=UPI0004F7A1C3|nr:hypothetical protein [Paenibacillus sp. FSL R7-0273]AIQ45186.1 hypothetical protein R70723_04200 [Paenibacillus sp. FSL R7-0273]OMF85704.1 hypothetical protein BK144_27465 [Paenibacillus sp. FSL R7-0273]